ncbi:MAG: histidine phosphatase family protein [Nanoarchaeota archaeon]|nr:histidine phosphatase family protein [Nanoarchaeota archaeon]
MEIILTRHGETIENIEGRFQGQLPGKLSKKGEDQAKKLAIRLKDEKFDYILSSDLTRCADTAKEIRKFHQNTPIEFTKELRERNLGELEGVRKSDLGLDPNKLVAGTIESKKGETQKEMFNRAKKFINKLLKRFPGKKILIVGHNGINKALTANILNKTFKDYEEIEPQLNCAVSIFSLNENNPAEIKLWNCIKHL